MPKPSIRSASNMQKIALRFCLLGVLLFMLPAFASAEWYKDYESAMDMIKKGDNAGAIPKLQAAISQKSEEGSNIKFYGMKFGDYFPHYYLGMAYFSQKDYESAMREFDISERTGALHKKNDLYGKMNSVRTLAKAQLTIKQEPQIVTNNPQVNIPITPTQEDNKQTTRPPETKLPEVKSEDKKIADLQVQNPPSKTTPESTTPTDINKQNKPPDIQPTINADSDAAKFMLKNGARKYFEGDYDAAINYLSSAVDANPKEPSAHFLLGCSYASKYLLSGSENKELLKSASAAFVKLKKLNPGYKPRNKAYFSPAVLDLYSGT